MAFNTIITQSMLIGGIDTRIQMSASATQNTYFTRKHGIPSSSWNAMRFGVVLQMDKGTGTLPGSFITNLGLGLCHGTGTVGSAFAKNVIWIGNDANPWNYADASGANMTYWAGGGNTVGFTHINNVGSFSAPFGATQYIGAEPSASTRTMMFVEVVKGNPNFTLRAFWCTSPTSVVDVTPRDFFNIMAQPDAFYYNHTYYTGPNMAFSEAAGELDSVFVYWSGYPSRVFISEMAVAVMA